MLFFLLLLGLAFGSFVGALTHRIPRNIPFVFGRSFCPLCGEKIAWYDNIPIFSFVFLKGRCRYCGRKISWRYPLIELFTGIGFVLIYILLGQGRTLSWIALPYFLIVFLVLEVIFVVDWESKIILDFPVFFLFLVFLITSLLVSDILFWTRLFFAFLLSSVLLFLNLLTGGKGMGLGDVKLALPLGFFLGFPMGLLWLFISFLTGAFVGVILILVGKAKFGKTIPFGPFLIFSFWFVLFFYDKFVF